MKTETESCCNSIASIQFNRTSDIEKNPFGFKSCLISQELNRCILMFIEFNEKTENDIQPKTYGFNCPTIFTHDKEFYCRSCSGISGFFYHITDNVTCENGTFEIIAKLKEDCFENLTCTIGPKVVSLHYKNITLILTYKNGEIKEHLIIDN